MTDSAQESRAPGLDCSAIAEAAERIRPYIRKTPLLRDDSLDRETGAALLFKCENLQVSGSFKARGAFNAVFSLSDEEAARGVVTHSSGNHAGALALAAAARGIPAHLVMPRNAPRAKVANVESAGGTIYWCEPTMRDRERRSRELQRETGAVMIHPFNDYRVMAGQGTVGLEIADAVPDLGAIVVPVSGGGLLSGVAVAIRARLPRCRITGVEPEGADDATRSFREKRLRAIENPRTIADGLRATALGSLTFPLIAMLVNDMVTVSEEAIRTAMEDLSDRLKIPVEASGAVPFAAMLPSGRHSPGCPEGRIAVILTGGNLD